MNRTAPAERQAGHAAWPARPEGPPVGFTDGSPGSPEAVKLMILFEFRPHAFQN